VSGNERWHQLMVAYLVGEISKEEFSELEGILESSAEARELFHHSCRIDTRLRREAGNPVEADRPAERKIISVLFHPITWSAVAAAMVWLAMLVWSQRSQPQIVAELISAEDASWESSLPTEPGSKLTRGYLKLMEGIATIRFRSGAEMMLEAPAKLTIKGPMRAKLVSGSAVMNVPESAIGFLLETPDGHVVDHGTAFAVSVAGGKSRSTFEVIDGEIAVHLPEMGEEVRLFARQTAAIVDQELTSFDGPLPQQNLEVEQKVFRMGTKGHARSVIRANRDKWLHPDLLMVKRTDKEGNHDRRAFFSFDLSGVDFENVASARIRLNQVPSGIGYATRIPKVNRFGIYGLTSPAKVDWDGSCTWEESPAPEDGSLLGTFEVLRSRQRGSYGIGNADLLQFLKSRQGARATFVIDRLTTQIPGDVPGRVHAFASDSHPEASGPILEFILKD
tara:strand:- start:10159 stop:11505 length:1347 start_codon:yes stop_codon:yes gene_type:complete